MNNSEATKQDNTEDLRCNEEPGASGVRQEATDEISTNSSSTSSSSPSSVLPIQQKTTTDQEIHIGVQQSDMEDVAQEIVNGEGPLDSMSQNIHPFMDDPHVESHNNDLDHSQVSVAVDFYYLFFIYFKKLLIFVFYNHVIDAKYPPTFVDY